MAKLIPADLTFSEVRHLPIIKEFAKKIKLVETLDTMVDSQMELAPGVTVMAMVLDTLSGRTPLYRLEEFFQEKDVELILGQNVSPALLTITSAACWIRCTKPVPKGSFHSLPAMPSECLTLIRAGRTLTPRRSVFLEIMILPIRR